MDHVDPALGTIGFDPFITTGRTNIGMELVLRTFEESTLLGLIEMVGICALNKLDMYEQVHGSFRSYSPIFD